MAWGLATLEMSTGEFWIIEFPPSDQHESLIDELGRLEPRELIHPSSDSSELQKILKHFPDCRLVPQKDNSFDLHDNQHLLSNHFHFNSTTDLDISTLTHSERKLIYRHGLMGRLWSAYWYFYGLSFKHRSKWTHRPILGTALRLVYLFWLPLIVGFVVDPDITTGFLLSEYFIAYFVGLVIADTGHWLADGMP